MKTRTDFEDLLYKANNAVNVSSSYPEMVYEENIKDILEYILEYTNESPLD